MTDDATRARLRALPAVDHLASALATGGGRTPVGSSSTPTGAEAVGVARAVLDQRRAELIAGAQDAPDLVALARARLRPQLRRVLNGTGVVVHTNLGRAPLAATAAAAAHDAALGYVDLELDVATGRRGARGDQVRALLCELTGAQDALVVNNGAAAALLATAALAGAGGAVVVSRGQLVEIGGGFRIPEVIAQAGARLVEVGTTNRTRPDDYARALDEHPGAVVLRVHPANFRTVGFVADVAVEELCALGAPVIDDVGSGVLTAGPAAFAEEPPIDRSVAAGAALVAASADKLLGGPQAGLLVGTAEAVERARRHPLARALRVGRLPLAALAATLALHRDPQRARAEVPVLAMIAATAEELRARANQLAAATGGEVVAAESRVGGGALPLLPLPGPVVAYDDEPEALSAALRAGDPPLLARIAGGRVLVDPRTLPGDDLAAAIAALRAARASP